MNSDTKIACLKDEYLLLQRFYEDFDARVITIKGWSATIGLAAIGGGFYQNSFLWLFAAGASLVFWAVEAVWKSFQYMYAPRIAMLEEAFLREAFDKVAPFQIYTSWFEAFERKGFHFLANMRLGIVMFPHLVTLIAGVGLFLLESLGAVNIPRGK